MLSVEHVTKKYGNFTALEDICLTFENGVYGLLAPNGAGKTTLIKMLATLLFPTSGMIRWNGEEIRAMGESYRCLLGYLPQEFGYYRNYSPKQFLKYMAALQCIEHRTAGQRIEELLEEVSLSDVKNKKMRQFSGGMLQRVGIAQAMLNNPKLLILDEPTAALDPRAEAEIYARFNEMVEGRTSIYISHRMSSCRFCDDIIVFEDGRIVERGSHETLFAAGGSYARMWNAQARYYEG